MRHSGFILSVLFTVCAAATAYAQSDNETFSPLALAVACAPPPSLDAAPPHALRIIGSQDANPRSLFGDRDLLVINGGTAAGVQLGQQYFIRRTLTFGANQISRGAKTLGWIRVVSVNDSTAIGLVDHVCGGIVLDDYLEPFVAPDIAALATRDEATGQPDFTALGHIVAGNEDRDSAGPGDFVLIDWGREQGLTAGAHFAIVRDVGVYGLPLVSVGEGVVVSIGSTMALTRVTRARDAVYSGDFVALRR